MQGCGDIESCLMESLVNDSSKSKTIQFAEMRTIHLQDGERSLYEGGGIHHPGNSLVLVSTFAHQVLKLFNVYPRAENAKD